MTKQNRLNKLSGEAEKTNFWARKPTKNRIAKLENQWIYWVGMFASSDS